MELKEDIWYYNFAISLYYLSLLKHINFNVERQLRVKFICKKHDNLIKERERDITWLCKYGIDSNHITEVFTSKESRQQTALSSIEEYFSFDEDKGGNNLNNDEELKSKTVKAIIQRSPDIKTCFERMIRQKIII